MRRSFALACLLVIAGCRFGFEDTTRNGVGPDGPGGNGDGGVGGSNGDGGGGSDDGGGATSDAPLMLAPTVRLAAGAAHTCVITNAGTVRCWGDNQYGQLGYGNTTRIGDNEAPSTAGDVQLGGIAVAIAAGEAHTCALLENGHVRCWGDNQYGQLGYGNTTRIGDDELPSSAGDVNVGALVTAISVGVTHTCVVTVTGGVRCWGDNMYGQLGYGNTTRIGDNELPSSVGDVQLGGTAVAVSVGTAHTCALLDTKAVKCWGDNMYGQLGYGNTTRIGDNELPSTVGVVSLGGNAIGITADEVDTCALLDTGAVRCWGDSMYGQLGYGNTNRIGDNELPSAVATVALGANAAQIAVGYVHTCARLASGAMRCWGDSMFGQLGYGNTTRIGDNEAPSAAGDVPVGGTVVEIATGMQHTCARLSTGAVRCWGDGTLGRLGYGNTTTLGDTEPASAGGDVPF